MEGSAYMPIYYYTDPIMVSQAVADWEKLHVTLGSSVLLKS